MSEDVSMHTDQKTVRLSALILGGAIIVATIIASYTFYRVRAYDDSLSVTGSATKDIASDQVKWIGAFQETSYESGLRSGYAGLANDQKTVLAYLQKAGIKEAGITFSTVSQQQVYKQNDSDPREYSLIQTFEIDSADVAGITALSKKATELAEAGMMFSTQSIEYSYSKLPDLRVSLLADAIKDARARAESIAANTDRRVGSLKSASSGVVQVLPVNSADVSDYGTYDTSSIGKTVMVTVKAAFTLR